MLNDSLRTAVGKGGLRIANFHRVLDNNIDHRDYRYLGGSPTVDYFDQILGYLSSQYNIISIKDYLENAKSLDPGKLYVAVTFDDGYLDNFTNALPVFRKYNTPVTIFVSTDALDGKPLWFQKIYCAINDCKKDQVLNPCTGEAMQLKNKWLAMNTICKSILKLPVEDYEQYISELFIGCDVMYDGRTCEPERMMSWEDIDVLKNEKLVDIGSHTMTHYPLVGLSDKQICNELEQSFKKLMTVLGYQTMHMAYPNGAFNEKVKAVAKEVGYSAAFTMDRGVNNYKTDLFQMRREYLPNNPRGISFQLDNWDLRIKKALRMGE